MVSYKNETMKQTVFIQLLFYTYGLFSYNVNRIQDGLFQGCSRMRGGAFWPPLLEICHTYPTMMKLGTVIGYLRKTQKIYKSRDSSLQHQQFLTRNQQILLHQEIQV